MTKAFGYLAGLATRGWKREEVDFTFVQKSIAYLQDHVKERPEQPFFLYHALSAPHDPWLPPALTDGKSEEGPRSDLVLLADWVVGQIMDTLDCLAGC